MQTSSCAPVSGGGLPLMPSDNQRDSKHTWPDKSLLHSLVGLNDNVASKLSYAPDVLCVIMFDSFFTC